MNFTWHIAVDLGSSNGRVFLGRLDGRQPELIEARRFSNAPVYQAGHWRWDWPYLCSEIRLGLRKAVELAGQERITSLGCCSWAQDFAMLDSAGKLLENPICYRDEFTRGLPQTFADLIAPTDLVKRVGGSISPITTLCKLKAMRDQYPRQLQQTVVILHMADLVHFDLCAQAVTDWTFATAGQMFNIAEQAWDIELLARLDIPDRILTPVVGKPSVIGRISPALSPHPALNNVPVVSTAQHDTSCATMVLRPLKAGVFFICLGSYAMSGLVLNSGQWPENANPREHTLIGIADRRWALFAGCAGLWIIQECRRIWQKKGRTVDDERLAHLAEQSAYQGVIDLKAPRFSKPADMITEIKSACRAAGIIEPNELGDVARLIFDSLAVGFERGIRSLEKAGQMPCRKLFLIGGGSKNQYLVRQIVRRLACEVVPGPAEATVLGNLILQQEVIKDEL